MRPDPRPDVERPRLDARMWARLERWGTDETVTAGQVLHRQGESQRDLLAIRSGRVEVIRESVAGDPPVRLGEHEPNEILGELSSLSDQVGYASAKAIDDGVVLRVPGDAVRRMLAGEGELADLVIAAFLARRSGLLRADDRAVQIVGRADDAASLELHRYVDGMEIPHRWIDLAEPDATRVLAAVGAGADDIPVVALIDRTLRSATSGELAEALGLAYPSDPGSTADLVVIGGGPAGLAAAVYGASEGLATVCLDAREPGGQAASSSRIENYPGFPTGLSGSDLASRAAVQALKFGARLSAPCAVRALRRNDDGLRVELADGTEISTRAVIVATGAAYRTLDIHRWQDFEGAGIYYAATELEARDCGGGSVVVVGGANSAGQAALFLASRGSQVDLVVRADDLGKGMSAYLVDRIADDDRIRVRTGSQVVELIGDDRLRGVRATTGDDSERIDVDGLFCFIGARPATGWLDGIALDEDGFVLTDAALPPADESRLPFETGVPGVFAAGDVRYGSMKRVAAAVGEGASAVSSVHRRLAADSAQAG